MEDKQAGGIIKDSRSQHSIASTFANRFELLHLAEQEADTSITPPDTNTSTEPKETSSAVYADDNVSTETETMLEDDEFGVFIELSFFIAVSSRTPGVRTLKRLLTMIKELDTLLMRMDEYWREAAKKNMPLIVAAWLSTTAFYAIQRIFPRIHRIAPDYTTLAEKWMQQIQTWDVILRFVDVPGLETNRGRFGSVIPLWSHGELLKHCRTSKEYEKLVPTAGARGKPEDFFPFSGQPDMIWDLDHTALDKMQESMRLILSTTRAISGIEASDNAQYICEPLLPLLDEVLKDKEKPIPLQLIFGYEMLLSSYKAHLWPGGKLNKENCRISVLKFAGDVQKSIRTAVNSRICACGLCNTGILEYEKRWLQTTESKLGNYLSEKRFDLYHQSPWTAGCHMIEILTLAIFEGSNLCFMTGDVCALLHLYNALRNLKRPIQPLKLLDQLCQVFLDELFNGALPTGTFTSQYRRALGGTMSRDYETKQGSSRLALPTTSNPRKRISTTFSLFYEIHNIHYNPSIETWERVYLGNNHRNATKKQQREILERIQVQPFNVPLDNIREAVLPEFRGPLPVARIDYFAVHAFCTILLARISRSMVPGCEGSGIIAVDALLENIMEHSRDRSRTSMLHYLKPLNEAKSVFAAVDESISLDTFLWAV